MTSFSHVYEAYRRSVESLHAQSAQAAVRELRASLLDMRNELGALSRLLDEAEERFVRRQRSGRAWEMYADWPFDRLPELEEQTAQQLPPNLAGEPQLSALLGQVEALREDTAARKGALEQKILTAWRARHPRFSSMGTLDDDLQSETVKDLKHLARR